MRLCVPGNDAQVCGSPLPPPVCLTLVDSRSLTTEAQVPSNLIIAPQQPILHNKGLWMVVRSSL
eukprot:32527-Eustigmatos_ZCMA.PRE.1